MKIFNIKTIVLATVFALFLSGCTQMTNTELLTSESWKLTELTSDDVDSDLLAFTKAIFLSSTTDYLEDGTFQITFTDSLFEDVTGTWKFNDDESQLLVTQTGEPEESYNISVLDEDNLGYTFTDSTGTYNFTYGH